MKQKMQGSIIPNSEWLNSKEWSFRIYIGIVLLILSLVIFWDDLC